MGSVAYAQRRGARDLAAKERRKKLFAFGGLGLLAVVLVIQVPRTLDMLSSDSAAVSSAPVPSMPSTTTAPAATAPKKAPRALRSARADDPFVAGGISDGETRPGAVGARGLRDPFHPGSRPVAPPTPVALPSVPQRIVVGTPTSSRPRFSGYTVVLASIPTSNSRAQAVSFARTARSRGVRSVGVLKSSTRNRLRPGYWVVYSGAFRRSSDAQRAASSLRARGYRGAYLRQLVRY